MSVSSALPHQSRRATHARCRPIVLARTLALRLTFHSPSKTASLHRRRRQMARTYSLGARCIYSRFFLPSRPNIQLSSRISSNRAVPRAMPRRFAHSVVSSSSFPHNAASNSNLGGSVGPKPGATLSQRLKHLIKSYGWYALGVYAVLTVADFTVAFAGISLIGSEHVARATDAVTSKLSQLFRPVLPQPGAHASETSSSSSSRREPGGRDSLMATAVLAWLVHKTLFMPFRVGLTVALTPKLVRWLTRRGWAGGVNAKRVANELRDKVRK